MNYRVSWVQVFSMEERTSDRVPPSIRHTMWVPNLRKARRVASEVREAGFSRVRIHKAALVEVR